MGIVVAAFVVLTSQGVGQMRGGNAATVLDGVYTEAQAERGAAQYEANCMICHEGNDPDGPPLLGDFIERWREDNLDSLFVFMKTTMPRDEPGKLSAVAYLDILAYLLRINTYRSGNKELNADDVAGIRLVGKDGPKPVPNNALVRIVGCLAQDSSKLWTITNAGEPARIRRAEESTAEELKASAARPLGSFTFRLGGFENTGFNPDSNSGRKVQAKGVLRRSPAGERINVLVLEIVGAGCER